MEEKNESVVSVISKVCEEICNDYCKYGDKQYEADPDGTCGHYDDCPLNKLQ